MNIKTIFSDNSLVRKAVEESYSMRITEDINAAGGAIFERSIRNGFNAVNDDYKLFNFSELENLIIPNPMVGEDGVDFGPFASTLSELKKKMKQSFGALSAADILLFKVEQVAEKSRFVLVDVASLKCSIPKDLSEKGPSKIALHNDPSGDIHDALSSGEIAGKNIGQIILIILRGEDLRGYHFDGELSSLGSYFEIAETNEYGDLRMTSKDPLILSSYKKSCPVLLDTFNRKFEGTRRTKTGKARAITSFMRGVKVNISETKKRSPFELLRSLSEHGVIEEIFSIPFNADSLRQRICSQLNLIPEGFSTTKNDKKKTTQRKNIDKEQFFTQHDTAKRLADFVKSQPWFDPEARIIEPAAGDGAWSDLFEDCLAYDIDPQKQGIVKADFLGLELDYIPKTISLGNPPFGRMGKLALQFIDKCSEISDYIAFILPASFGKATVKRRVPKDFHLIHQEEMLDETFRFERDGRKVATVFQVWERGTTERIDPPLIHECDDFSFVKNPEGADLAIRTHGSGYGLVFRDNFQDISPRTHRFIKAKAETPKLIAQRLEGIDYYQTAKFTTGAPCVATSEIFKLYLAEKAMTG